MFQVGSIVAYGGKLWELFGCEVDDEGFIGLTLIDPEGSPLTNDTTAKVIVRDFSTIQPAYATRSFIPSKRKFQTRAS